MLKSRGYSRSRSESCDAAPIPASPFKFSFVDSFRPCKRGGVFSHPYLYEKPPREGSGLMRSDAASVEHLVYLVRFRHQPCGEVLLDIKGVPWVCVRQILIIGVTGDVVLIREEGAHAPKLQDALAAVQHRQLVYRGKVFAQLLIVQAVGYLPSTALAGVEGVDGLFPQRLIQLLQRTGLLAAQKDGAVAVADNGVGVVLVQRLQLALGLQDETGGNLAAADGSHELFQVRYLPDVGALIDEAAHMDGEPSAVHVVGLFAQQVK